MPFSDGLTKNRSCVCLLVFARVLFTNVSTPCLQARNKKTPTRTVKLFTSQFFCWTNVDVAVAGGNSNFSGQTRKYFHLWAQSTWVAGIGRHRRQTHTTESQQHPSNVFYSCNTACYNLQIVDCEGEVWSCGKNDYGQLALGHTNASWPTKAPVMANAQLA